MVFSFSFLCRVDSIRLGKRSGAFLVAAQRARIFRRPQFGDHDAARMRRACVFLLRRPRNGMDRRYGYDSVLHIYSIIDCKTKLRLMDEQYM